MADTTQQKVGFSPFDMANESNALCYLINSRILSTVNVAIPVRVDSVTRSNVTGGASYLSATPLICQTDNEGNIINQKSIPKLRWFRLQHGKCAFVCDPEVGDIGLAVFCHSDVSGLTGGTTPIKPSTFRHFDMSDGIYIGGLWGKTPETYVRLEDGVITITSTGTVTVNAPSGATVNANTTINGNLQVNGTITATGTINDLSGGGGSSMDTMRSLYNSHVHGSSPTPTPQM